LQEPNRAAPTLADGRGHLKLSEATRSNAA